MGQSKEPFTLGGFLWFAIVALLGLAAIPLGLLLIELAIEAPAAWRLR